MVLDLPENRRHEIENYLLSLEENDIEFNALADALMLDSDRSKFIQLLKTKEDLT